LHFSWHARPGIISDYFEIEYSEDGNRFHLLKIIPALPMNGSYQYSIKDPSRLTRYYRLKSVYQQGLRYYSNIMAVDFQDEKVRLHFVSSAASSNHIIVSLSAEKSCQIVFYFTNSLGQVINKIPYQLFRGNQHISLPVHGLRAGYYQVFGLSSALHTNPLIFIKP
jgi:hypothetical protein